ncbi:peroxisomal biogenesis factor 19 isoform X3 [Monomorium pharaonis]|uniref:peroxisomal biogenesis factor 19 isoform X3 n=1 Tax=Monomorium pharaonis TaxID=307658 RepID=UPI001745E028|nr:peroxisomal biogenesis factor 19 isoform X3 [Monomorium pharaonis]
MTDNVKETKNEMEDKELNDLLDSALQDFDKVSISNVEKVDDTDTVNLPKQTDKYETCEDKWTEDFLKQTADQFERNLQNLLQNGDSELEAALQNMLGQTSVSNDVADDKDMNTDFQSTISQVLKDLTTNSESLQNEADVAAMLRQTSLDGDTGDILPFMQGMMEHLLSKEILYPSLKELSDKYPTWLEEHKTTLNTSDLQRYTKQSELMQKVLSWFFAVLVNCCRLVHEGASLANPVNLKIQLDNLPLLLLPQLCLQTWLLFFHHLLRIFFCIKDIQRFLLLRGILMLADISLCIFRLSYMK